MGHLCVGAYVRILTSCAITAERKYDPFCELVMLSLCDEGSLSFSYVANSDGSVITYDHTNFNKIHSGKQNLPTEVMKMAQDKDPQAMKRYFVRKVIPALDEGKKKNAVLALRSLILQDKKIVDSTQLGTLASLTKAELREKKEYILAEFLTDVFIYAVSKTDNDTCPDFLKTIKKASYASAFDAMTDSIKLYETERFVRNPIIPPTSTGKGFNAVFTPVASETLNIHSTHDLQIFCLQFEDTEFDYNGLWRYLLKNIGNYVYSRAALQRYEEPEELVTLAYDAIRHIKDIITAGKIPTGYELGELLLYLFLEQVLHATKFMSSVEIANSNGIYASESSGIYILADQAMPLSEIVLGTSMIVGDLQDAVNNAFDKVESLKQRKQKERRFVETSIFAETFTKTVAQQLTDIILPSEADKKKPATAFGIFLGYSLGNIDSSGKTVDEYQRLVMDQLKDDIRKSAQYIEKKIDQYSLDTYSIYIYVLPFSNAEEDQKAIMDSLLMQGGGAI